MTESEIIKKAEIFCEDNNITDYPVNIVKICENQGFSVFEQYLPIDVSGFIVAQEEPLQGYNSNKIIVVNLSDGACKRRFTIAHELAHFLLHKKADNLVYAHILQED